jgi:hypothetical protein
MRWHDRFTRNTAEMAKERFEKKKRPESRKAVGRERTIWPMIIQTNPERFSSRLLVHTVTSIDRSRGIATISKSDGTSLNVRLDSWGTMEATQPVIGSRVQLLENH